MPTKTEELESEERTILPEPLGERVRSSLEAVVISVAEPLSARVVPRKLVVAAAWLGERMLCEPRVRSLGDASREHGCLRRKKDKRECRVTRTAGNHGKESNFRISPSVVDVRFLVVV